MIKCYYNRELDLLDEVVAALDYAYVSWSWSSNALVVRFDFKNQVKGMITALGDDPEKVTTAYAQLMILSQCKGVLGYGKFIFQNFDIM